MSKALAARAMEKRTYERMIGSHFRPLRDIEEFHFHPNSSEQETGGKRVLYLGLTKRQITSQAPSSQSISSQTPLHSCTSSLLTDVIFHYSRMRMPGSLAKLGFEAITSSRAPPCTSIRCMGMARTLTAPSNAVPTLSSSPAEPLPFSSPVPQILSYQEPLLPSMAQQLPDPEPLLFRYNFREPLTEGVIIKKRKRFTAEVLVDGQVIVAHCPTTCLSLYQTLLNGQQVRCLLSRADPAVKRPKERETQYSVEAIALDGSASWMGINQCHVTRYIGHYLRAGGMPSICADPSGLRAEQMVGARRIDFVNEGIDSIEVKMPPPRRMREAAMAAKTGGKPYSERFRQHLLCMTEWLQEQRSVLGLHPDKAWQRRRQIAEDPELRDPRAILLLAYQHDEPPMRLPRRITSAPSPMMEAMRAAIKAGLEVWQCNMVLDKNGVVLTSYFPRRLLRGRPQRHISALSGHDYMLHASCALPSAACSSGPRDGLQQTVGGVILPGLASMPYEPAGCTHSAAAARSGLDRLQEARGQVLGLSNGQAEALSETCEDEELVAVAA